jgi:hypothetical protein
MAWRRRALIWCWLLLCLVPGAAQAQGQRVTGQWQQFIFDQDSWRSLGLYRVVQSGTEYRMEPVSQSQDKDVTTSKGLFDVKFSDADWEFKSDWGKGNTGQFRLKLVATGMYLGWSYLREEKQNFNMWLLVR